MKNSYSMIFILLLFVVAFGFFVSLPSTTSAQSPFGGPIISMKPCLHPFSGIHIQVGPPNGGSFIYQYGLSFSYPFGPPVHVGQWLLGLSTGVLSCSTKFDGYWQDFRSGGLILFHGSSI